MSEPPRIVVVGGGISGMAAALRLAEGSVSVTLLESGPRLGGVLDTVERDGCLVEQSADMFTTKAPWALELCRETGYEDQLIQPQPDNRRALLVHRGRLTPVPEGLALLKPVHLGKLLRSPVLSYPGKLRVWAERWVPARGNAEDESLAEFARRRMGREFYERIAQPLIGGIYTADPQRLSMRATMPQFLEMERKYGSLIRAAKAEAEPSDLVASGARYDQFVAPRHGFRHLIDHLGARLPQDSIRTGAAVESVRRDQDQWRISLGTGESLPCDGVLLATPSHVSAELLRSQDEKLAGELAEIPYAGSSVVIAAARRNQFARPLDGFGLVSPLVERRRVLAVSFASLKFAGRAPDDQVLLRAFVGGAVQPELNELDDQQLEELVTAELRELMQMQGDPLWMDVVRWNRAMPQYHVGHVERIERIKQLADQHHGLVLAGAAYRGVGIPFCVRSGRAAADRLLEQFRSDV